MTHPAVLAHPANPTEAVDCVLEWFRYRHVTPVNPGIDHLPYLRRNLDAAGVGANLITDAHIAAIAMEYQAEVHSNDTDFSRFPGLRWRNPL
jgi:predicted nucleic acid-binding protein